ncbi:hypothetical protein OAU79_00910, partial [bacterium]|nr:hypothetical protein [bacterium]
DIGGSSFNFTEANLNFRAENGDLIFVNLANDVQVTVNSTKHHSASNTIYTDGSPSQFNWDEGFTDPAQINWVDIGGGKLAISWAVDIWKENPDMSMNSDYDLFFAVIDGVTGEILQPEQKITENFGSDYIQAFELSENGLVSLKYEDGADQSIKYAEFDVSEFVRSAGQSGSINGSSFNFTEDNLNFRTENGDLIFVNLANDAQVTVNSTKHHSASNTIYTDGSPSQFNWDEGFTDPAQINWVDIGGGKLAISWAVDIWKENPDMSMNSDYDLFFAVIDGVTGEILQPEQKITENFGSDYIQAFELSENGLVSLKYEDGADQSIKYAEFDVSEFVRSAGQSDVEEAELAQGFKVTDFAVKDEYGNWVNTIESIVFTSPTTEHAIDDKYAEGVIKGTKSGYDSLTDALKTGLGTEYFLSPSGVVDLGIVRTPASFNPDGSVKTFKEVKNWDGPETDKNFFLIANTDMAGQNISGLGFDGSSADYTLSGDKNAATPLYLGAHDVLMSGAAKHDIMVGSNNDDFVDVMFGHGGDDAMQAEGGRNIVVGGSGADTFVIEAVGQQTVIYGDQVIMDSLGFKNVFSTGVEHTFRASDNNNGYGHYDIAYTAHVKQYDDNGNHVGRENADIIFTDLEGTQHKVASASDLVSGTSWGDSVNAESMGNGNYLITYSSNNNNNNNSEIYYRIFDTQTGDFTDSATSLGIVPQANIDPYGELQEDGRVVIKDNLSNSFSAEVTDNGTEVEHTFRASDNNNGYGHYDIAYTAHVKQYDDNGNHIGRENADIIFADLEGTQHIVASASDLSSGTSWGDGGAQAESMGNGNYLITYSSRNDNNNSSEIYYRIFDTQTGDFTDSATSLGTVPQGYLYPYGELQEDGRVVIKDNNSNFFSAEVRDNGTEVEHTFRDGFDDTIHDIAYTAHVQEYDENWNHIGRENEYIIFTDLEGTQHIVASASAKAPESDWGNGVDVESMGNGNYLITYISRNTGDSSEIYYRIFDTQTGDFTDSATSLGTVPRSDIYPYGELQEDGRVLIKDSMNYSFSAEVTDNSDVKIETQNESYDDQVFFDFTWPLTGEDGEKNPDSYIEQLGDRHFNVHHTTENGDVIDVALFDVEGAYFSDGEGGLEYHALTSGRPITKDDFGSLNYESQGVKFLVEHNDETAGGATTISVVTSVTKTITDPVTKEKITYEDPTVKWKGLASDADSFVFNDVTVNVINISQTDLTGAQIIDTTIYGTSGIDLIIGDEFDNLIFGGDDNDIIFGGDGADEIYGEGGDDVLIGAAGEDILYGDFQHELDEPEIEYNTRNAIL